MVKQRKSHGQGFDKVVDRIKEATGKRTQVELAGILDIRQSSISDAKRRNSVPADWYMKLFRKYGLNPDWLADGRGPKYIKTIEGEYQTFDEPLLSETVREDGSGYGDPYAVSKVVATYEMGGGSAEGKWKPKAAGKLSIPKALDKESLLVVRLNGKAMEPLIRAGSFVGLDRDQQSVLSGEIYGIQVPFEGLVIRRLFLDGGTLTAKAESADIADQTFNYEECADKIIGRVVWAIQEL